MELRAKNQEQQENSDHRAPSATGRLHIIYYTDPLCCWSWTFESAWQQLKHDYAPILSWRYCMAGLLADWKTYHDPLNAVSKPLQMGPVWMQAKQLSQTQINDRIWYEDPPASSYPACVAVKCAARQSQTAEELYLQQLRKAVMLQGRNIAKKETLLTVANEVAAETGVLNVSLFEKELAHPDVIAAFKKDLQEVSFRNITRFPTLLITSPDKKGGLMLTGSRPYTALTGAIDHFVRG